MSEGAQCGAVLQSERSCAGQGPLNTSSKFATFIAALLLVGLALQLSLSGRQQSQTFDEADHILAGYRYWMCSDFSANPEHPPLVKLVASVPLLLMKVKGPAPLCGYPEPSTERDFADGRTFLYSNNAESILFSTRLFACFFTIFLGVLVFKSAHLMFGTGPALIALTIYSFEPNILAHGFLVTTDMGLACCLYGAVFTFYCYLEERSIGRLALAGILAGCTVAAKHSGVVIIPILLVIAIADLAMREALTSEDPRSIFRKRRLMMLGGLTCIGLIAYVTVWAFYAFRFSARPGSEATVLLRVGLTPEPRRLLGRGFTFLLHMHFLPESYLLGLKHVLSAVHGGGPVFLLGRSYPNGRWFYFPAVFLLKSTLGFLLLLILGSVGLFLTKSRNKRALSTMIIPPVLFMAICLGSNLDIGVRHILPIYPFLIMIAAAGVWDLRKYWAARYLLASLIAIHVVSSLRSFPDYIPYANEAFGGPTNTYKMLGASNADWGQSLRAINRYVQANEVGECWIAYLTNADPTYYPTPCRLLPTAERWISRDDMSEPRVQGTLLIGANELEWTRDLSPYAQLRNLVPSQSIGGSVLVFRGQFELPMAFALSRINRAAILIHQGQCAEAIIAAREAVTAAPEIFSTHAALARAFAAAHRDNEAQTEYQTAILLAESVDPEYHPGALEELRRELRQLTP
jgi:4-amino-4-deoxy-L-arabinose transferase-like glycosyltransferase